MFDDELSTISLSGTVYPIRCDILVLEKIQEKYGTVEDFERAIDIWESEPEEDEKEGERKIKIPTMSALGDALFWFAKEGEAIRAKREGRPAREFSREDIIRENDVGIFVLSISLMREFRKCFATKKATPTKTEKKPESQ